MLSLTKTNEIASGARTYTLDAVRFEDRVTVAHVTKEGRGRRSWEVSCHVAADSTDILRMRLLGLHGYTRRFDALADVLGWVQRLNAATA